jgi:phenylpropionate dioxygenase-like ring-hydroxylating dioxygenase large terminal subunit
VTLELAADDESRPRIARHPTLPPFPRGWYTLAFSHELKPGRLLDRRLAGQDLVLFRGSSGRAVAIDAWCPHMGAHFARTGARVVGDTLRCAFHGFTFDGSGACTATGYETKPPVRARARTWPLREQDGLLLVWSGPGEPDWEVPRIDESRYTPIARTTREFTLRSHPQQMTENSVDIGHLSWTHAYEGVQVISPLRTDGPYLTAAYAMRRNVIGPLGVDFEFTVHVHGLGYSQVDVRLPRIGIETRHWVLPTPTDEGRVTLRLALTLKRTRGGELVDRAIASGLLLGFVNETRADFPMWEHTRHTHPPVLGAGDGPIIPYRRWAAQFYA